MDISNVKNIIFDLGGVILNIEPQNTYSAFKELGFKEMDDIRSNKELFNTLIDYEKGIISTHNFREVLKSQTNKNISDTDIDNAWNSMILDIPVERVKKLEELKENYRIYLLSNTSELHFDCFNTNFASETKYKGLCDLFEKDYYSHVMGMRKPDLEIYQEVLRDSNLNARETLFVDDFEENVQAARELGMKAYQVKTDQGLLELFK